VRRQLRLDVGLADRERHKAVGELQCGHPLHHFAPLQVERPIARDAREPKEDAPILDAHLAQLAVRALEHVGQGVLGQRRLPHERQEHAGVQETRVRAIQVR
jgi:hypothetical protein